MTRTATYSTGHVDTYEGVHRFDDTGDAYDACQYSDDIKTGDALVIPAEGVVGLAWTWPVAVTVEAGHLHQITGGQAENGLGVLGDAGMTTAQVARAVALADAMGAPVVEWARDQADLEERQAAQADLVAPATLGGHPVVAALDTARAEGDARAVVVVDRGDSYADRWVTATWWPDLGDSWSWGHYLDTLEDVVADLEERQARQGMDPASVARAVAALVAREGQERDALAAEVVARATATEEAARAALVAEEAAPSRQVRRAQERAAHKAATRPGPFTPRRPADLSAGAVVAEAQERRHRRRVARKAERLERRQDHRNKAARRAFGWTGKESGIVLYEGPSAIDGAPIVVIATGLKSSSTNAKTGSLIQTWILRADIAPTDAVNSGADESVCGNCPHRGKVEGGKNVERSCYVLVFQAPLNVWRTYHAGKYPRVTPEQAAEILAMRSVRLGAYGDPAAVPFEVWGNALQFAARGTGYTHQWAESFCDQRLSRYCMASADNAAQAAQAAEMGWRTFRVGTPEERAAQGREITCPASKEAGQRTNCAACLLCGGTSVSAKHIFINAHGAAAKVNAFVKTAIN